MVRLARVSWTDPEGLHHLRANGLDVEGTGAVCSWFAASPIVSGRMKVFRAGNGGIRSYNDAIVKGRRGINGRAMRLTPGRT
jgi:hypothetical protein